MSVLTRRRFLAVTAAAGASLAAGHARAAPYVWSGFALGADARITLRDAEPGRAEEAVRTCVAEIERLEEIFSLYRGHSEVCTLNRDRRVSLPSPDMVHLLHAANAMSRHSRGLFDITVQPMWKVLADHFAQRRERTMALARELAAAREHTGWHHIEMSPKRIVLPQGFALTFNGIAQGYITDRVADLLRAAGWRDVLVDFGELRALEGRDWQVDAAGSGTPVRLVNAAIATSSGSGTRFDRDGRWNHLIDPRDGACANPDRTVSVVAPSATLADALSTAASLVDDSALGTLAQRFPAARFHVRRRG